jgi:hypothetical protein
VQATEKTIGCSVTLWNKTSCRLNVRAITLFVKRNHTHLTLQCRLGGGLLAPAGKAPPLDWLRFNITLWNFTRETSV